MYAPNTDICSRASIFIKHILDFALVTLGTIVTELPYLPSGALDTVTEIRKIITNSFSLAC